MFLHTDDLNARLNKFYYELDDIDSQIEEAEKRLASVQQQKINSDTIYKYLLYFDKYYDSFTDAEKKEFMQTFTTADFLNPSHSNSPSISTADMLNSSV